MVDPGQKQLKKDLYHYRFKEVLIQLFEYAENYSASDEWLHSKLFAEKAEGIRLIWEYTNMVLIHCGGDSYLENYPSDNKAFKMLSEFYRGNDTLPLSEEKIIVSLFRKMIRMDSYVEELTKTKAQQAKFDQTENKQGEDGKEEVDIEGFKDLPVLISRTFQNSKRKSITRICQHISSTNRLNSERPI